MCNMYSVASGHVESSAESPALVAAEEEAVPVQRRRAGGGRARPGDCTGAQI